MNQWLVVGITALMPMVVGFAWYHKALFGNAWMQSIGKTEEDIQQGNMPVTFGVSFIMAFIVSMMLYYILHGNPEHGTDGLSEWMHGAFHGVQIAGMLAVPVLVSNSLFEQKSWTNILINGAYWIVAFAAMGAVCGALGAS